MTSNPALYAYSCIVIDKAHERTEATDLLLGGLENIIGVHRDLKLSSCRLPCAKISRPGAIDRDFSLVVLSYKLKIA